MEIGSVQESRMGIRNRRTQLERWNSFPPNKGGNNSREAVAYRQHLIQQGFGGKLNQFRKTSVPHSHLPNNKLYRFDRSSNTWYKQRRPVLLRHQSISPPYCQMTVGARQGMTRPQQKMDMFSEICSPGQSCVDQSPVGDGGNLDSTIYASSPNSLFMYEQEKVDMQNSFGNPSCGSMSNMFFNDEFDLKTRYELSRDICQPVSSTSTGTNSNPSNSLQESSWGDDALCKKGEMGLVKTEDEFEPTLAELNTRSEENSLMDIGSLADIINLTSDSLRSMSNLELLTNTQVMCPVESDGNSQRESLMSASVSSGNSLRNWTNSTQTTSSGMFPSTVMVSRSQSVSAPERQRSSVYSSSATVSKVPQSTSNQSNQNSTLHKLLSGTSPSSTCTAPSPGQSNPVKRKSPPADDGENSVERKWEEIKQYLHNEQKNSPTQVKVKRDSLESTSSTISVDDSDYDSDNIGQFLSDSDSDDSQDEWISGKVKSSSRQMKKEQQQYFWQYNIQSKGPKGKRVSFELENNPHKVQDFEDPVFDQYSTTQLGTTIRHGGKARKGDGNDVIPNPKKLCQIGSQLKRLNKQINTFAPLSELPVSNRNKSKKEKNKLASRACRLKKKAQHEANKVKLYGLDMEHKQLLFVINSIRKDLHEAIINKKQTDENKTFAERLEEVMKENLKTQVAGNTTEYVNAVIKEVEGGDPTGGLNLKGHT